MEKSYYFDYGKLGAFTSTERFASRDEALQHTIRRLLVAGVPQAFVQDEAEIFLEKHLAFERVLAGEDFGCAEAWFEGVPGDVIDK